MTAEDKNADVTNEDIYQMLAGNLLPSDVHTRRAMAAFVADPGYYFSNMNTRTLLALVKQSRNPRFESQVPIRAVSGMPDQFVGMIPFKLIEKVVREELNKRPNLLNSVQSKAARQAKAKQRAGKRGSR